MRDRETAAARPLARVLAGGGIYGNSPVLVCRTASKGPESATITGPGSMCRSASIDAADPDLVARLMEQTVLWYGTGDPCRRPAGEPWAGLYADLDQRLSPPEMSDGTHDPPGVSTWRRGRPADPIPQPRVAWRLGTRGDRLVRQAPSGLRIRWSRWAPIRGGCVRRGKICA
jgi:hypothetical protein